ncbi:hypothetical protein HPP92_029125 [Vanilla planifolia]|uniref:Uncharacterized protein n=1 Tax=Vanilla planifolia TaxID=51239 RepID=A0A835P3H9_VANPL|nr:hypothetical protein HPP92_029125 [Vanilla planifolia]KAG0445881.1 hypothetical protein HPP92_029113 [Vanilla planifolia]
MLWVKETSNPVGAWTPRRKMGGRRSVEGWGHEQSGFRRAKFWPIHSGYAERNERPWDRASSNPFHRSARLNWAASFLARCHGAVPPIGIKLGPLRDNANCRGGRQFCPTDRHCQRVQPQVSFRNHFPQAAVSRRSGSVNVQ